MGGRSSELKYFSVTNNLDLQVISNVQCYCI